MTNEATPSQSGGFYPMVDGEDKSVSRHKGGTGLMGRGGGQLSSHNYGGKGPPIRPRSQSNTERGQGGNN